MYFFPIVSAIHSNREHTGMNPQVGNEAFGNQASINTSKRHCEKWVVVSVSTPGAMADVIFTAMELLLPNGLSSHTAGIN